MIEPKKQTVYIVHGLRRIREVVAEIHVCDKMTWARYPSGARVKSHLLGTSAFFTRKAAETRKLGELRKLAERNYPSWHNAGRACDAARAQLKAHAETGTIH